MEELWPEQWTCLETGESFIRGQSTFNQAIWWATCIASDTNKRTKIALCRSKQFAPYFHISYAKDNR